MSSSASALLVVTALAACASAAPGDRGALRERLARDPGDVRALLKLAELDERERPSAALEALEEAARRSSMLGPAPGAADRARMGRLLLRRGRARLVRGAASALEDLDRAAAAGAVPSSDERVAATLAAALGVLRSVDRSGHPRALAELAALAARGQGPTELRGARAGATVLERGRLGAWLWRSGALRAGHDQLARWWRAGGRGPAVVLETYLVAHAWWAPRWRGDGAPAPAEALVGPRRCAAGPAPGCTPRQVRAAGWDLTWPERDLLRHPPLPTADPEEAAAWAELVARAYLAGELEPWREVLTARIDLPALRGSERWAELPRAARPLLARLAGAPAEAAAEQLLAGAPRSAVALLERALAGDLVSCAAPGCRRLRGVAPEGDARQAQIAGPELASLALGRAVRALAGGDERDERELARLAASRDLERARRRLAERVARADDAALAHAQAGAFFELQGDPASARQSWQRATALSPEPRFLLGEARALAQAGDAAAALVAATRAAAAAGDPAPVLTACGRALLEQGAALGALEVAKQALDLASADTAPQAWALASDAAAALARPEVSAALEGLRSHLAWAPSRTLADPRVAALDPSDPRLALAVAADEPAPRALERLWRASRFAVRSVEVRAAILARAAPGDPRGALAAAELVELASDPELAVPAVRALAASRP